MTNKRLAFNLNQTLSLFEIERFAIHDGPGIRTTVFLQGCPLRCQWCANPESQTVGKHILTLSGSCVGCKACASVCPTGAITVPQKAVIDRSLCVLCGTCAANCPAGALGVSGQSMSVDDLFSTLMRDKDYYKNSGGGVTFSGGEALLQISALLPLWERLRAEGISIAVETCGAVSVDAISEALPYVDLFLFDIKTLSPTVFQTYTGGDLSTVLTAFSAITEGHPEKVIVRVPVIPTVNFDQDSLTDIFTFAKEHKVAEVHLLPYHTLGMNKYAQLGRIYPFPVTRSLPEEEVAPYQKIGEDMGLRVLIGG